MPGLSGAIPARAKINLFLHVGTRRDDGFHPLQSLAVFPVAGDRLAAEEAADLSLQLDGPFAPLLTGEDNLVLRAARALAERAGCLAQAHLVLTKNLPVASGIGGGSADAAAALKALTRLWRLDLDEKALREIGADIGSDVPVCVASEPSFMEGRGEILTPVPVLPRLSLLLVNPGVAVATKDVFAALRDRHGVDEKLPRGNFGDLADLLRFLETTGNDLEAPAIALRPVIGNVLKALAGTPGALFSRMSGSGATCFALMADDDCCRRAAALLKQRQPDWWVEASFVPAKGLAQETAGQDIGPTPDGL